MTQTTSAAGGVVLEPSEFYYLVRMNAATTVVGLEAPDLVPPPGPAADARLQEGFAKLRFHGWLRAVERGRFDLNPELALLAAVVANPHYVVVAARNLSETEVAVANHYLGADLIVELTLTPERHVRLAFEPDRDTLLRRIEELLAPTPNPLAPARYNLPEPDFESSRAAARAALAAAAQRLEAAGFSPAHARSLAEALQTPVGDGRLVVVRAATGQILGGRKAATHDGAAGAWLSRREDPNSLELSVETVQAGTVSGVVESYLQALWVLREPVA
jgi:hypothetical protein